MNRHIRKKAIICAQGPLNKFVPTALATWWWEWLLGNILLRINKSLLLTGHKSPGGNKGFMEVTKISESFLVSSHCSWQTPNPLHPSTHPLLASNLVHHLDLQLPNCRANWSPSCQPRVLSILCRGTFLKCKFNPTTPLLRNFKVLQVTGFERPWMT